MKSKRIILTILIIIIILGFLFRIIYLPKDFTGEEIDFVRAAMAIKNTGHPVYYYSENVPVYVALWHPPMYIYLMSFLFRISEGELPARIINVFFSMITALFIYLFCIKIFDHKNGKIIGLISTAFFMINFYIFSSSVLIDIDILSQFFLFSFLFFLIMAYKYNKNYLFISGLCLYFGFWNRIPLAFLVYFLIGVYHFKKELKNKLKNYIILGVCSIVAFILSWAVYSVFIEPGNFFTFVQHNAALGLSQFSSLEIYLGSFFVNIIQFIRLFTFPGVFLMILSFFYLKRDKSIAIKFLMIYSLSILFFFILIPRPAFGFTRYFATMFPAVSILIGIFLYKNLKDIKINKIKIVLVLLSFVACLLFLLIANPYTTIYRTDGLIKSMNLVDFCFNLFASFPLFFVFFAKTNKKQFLVLILISIFLSYSLYFDIGMLTKKPYIKEVGAYIKSNTDNSSLIVCPEAVGYYAERKFYENDHGRPNIKPSLDFMKEYLLKNIEDRKMEGEFFWPGGYFSGSLSPLSNEKIQEVSYLVTYHKFDNKDYETKIGDYYIFKLKD